MSLADLNNHPANRSAGSLLDRTLPHSIEAEEYLLSTILLDGGAMLERAVAAKIRPKSFYDTKHEVVFEALLKMHAAEVPIEAATLAEHLRTTRQLESVGGFPFITQVSGRIPTTAGAAQFIKQVADLATVREIIRAGISTVEEAYNFTGDLAELAHDMRRRLDFAIEGPHSHDSWPDTISAADLCAHPPPTPAELIAGILYQRGSLLMAGPSKAHKTFTALEVAIAIANGTKWLGHATTQTPVLYLNLELEAFAMNDRVAKICAARAEPWPKALHLWNLKGRRVTLEQLTVQLPAKLRKTGAKVVSIDPHYKISSVSGMEENSNDDQGNLLNSMENICCSEQAALILTHHFAKGDASAKNAIDRASGGGVFARWGDVMMTFTPHEENDAMTVEMSLRYFPPVAPFVVRWVYPRWVRDKELDPAHLKTARGPKERHPPEKLLKVLGAEMMTYSEWLEASGVSETTFRRKREELLRSGLVVVQSGVYRAAS